MKFFLLSLFLFSFQFTLTSQVSGSLNHNGTVRNFVYYIPSVWNQSDQLPLLIVLHGLTQTGSGVMSITGFNDIAEQNNFIVCYPDGLNNAWNANMNVTVSSADDKGFIESLVLHFRTNYNTDPLRQYLCGFSNGGFMSHKMACESQECFAAIATVSGNMSDTVYNNCNPLYSTSVLHIHGTSDIIVPYNGATTTGVSVDQTIEKWRSFLSCDLTPVSVNMPNNNLFDLSSPEKITYTNCTSELELIKITGGGHQWPGIATLVGGAGTINMDFNSPAFIWDFLSGKSCSALSNLDEELKNNLILYPNPVFDVLTLDNIDFHEYKIFDVTGNLILQGKYQQNIEVYDLETGMYFLHLKNKQGESIVPFMK